MIDRACGVANSNYASVSGVYIYKVGSIFSAFTLTPFLGQRIRSTQKLLDATEKKPGHWLMKLDVTIEVEGERKPAVIAEMLFLHISEAVEYSK